MVPTEGGPKKFEASILLALKAPKQILLAVSLKHLEGEEGGGGGNPPSSCGVQPF